jgi:hypothetical protein
VQTSVPRHAPRVPACPRRARAAARRTLDTEPLERRLLLAAVTGVVFNDLNGNGLRDAGEPGLGGVLV